MTLRFSLMFECKLDNKMLRMCVMFGLVDCMRRRYIVFAKMKHLKVFGSIIPVLSSDAIWFT